MDRRRLRTILEASGVVVIVLLLVLVFFRHQGARSVVPPTTTLPSATTTPGSTTSTTSATAATVPFNGRIVNVTSFGADPTGAKDSRAAIVSALASAETKPGSELYFPAGTYVLKSVTKPLADFYVGVPIRIVGAGTGATTIIDEVGQTTGNSNPPIMFLFQGPNAPHPGGASGSLMTGFTLNAAKYQSGTPITDYANNTLIENLQVYAPTSTLSYNPNQFGVRVIAVCDHATYQSINRTGNVVANVSIIGSGIGGNTELDLSCQVNVTATNINIQGNGVDVDFCQHASLSNFTLVGGSNGDLQHTTWIVVGSHDVTLSNITTNGKGGVIMPAVKSSSSGITITHEVMKNTSGYLVIGDASGVTIEDSQLGGVAIAPLVGLSNVSIKSTSYTHTRCAAQGTVATLQGVACSG
ncbi:MAG: glycosyl hydrolase family 28-related protein [Acidimicrobiales bacterium]